MRIRIRIVFVVVLATIAAPAATSFAQSFDAKVDKALKAAVWPGVIRSAVGVTRRQTSIPSLIAADDLDLNSKKTRVLLVGGLEGDLESVTSTLAALKWFHSSDDATAYRKQFAVSAVPIANPDGWASGEGPGNLSDGTPHRGYPPRGSAYNSPTDPEAAYLWRWIGMHAPDLVIVLQNPNGRKAGWSVPLKVSQSLMRFSLALLTTGNAGEPLAADGLVNQLVTGTPSNTGTVPAIGVIAKPADGGSFLKQLLESARESKFTGPSPARKELQKRLARTPLQVAQQLSKRYGHDLNSVAYIPALSLIGRIRLGQLTDDPSHLADVEKIVAPYFTGKRTTLSARTSGSTLSGHLVFGELARATGKKRYVALVKAAADLGFDEQGQPKASMPFHSEMSDAVFMGGPILVQAGHLTGDKKYFDMALRHTRFMLKLNLRDDGLHRHSPLDQAAWGRGNGFPALGSALCLSEFPQDHPGRDELLAAFRSHIAALAKHQDPTGAWHQVVDHPGSYRELTSTCMITFSMIRGIRNGWLEPKTYTPLIETAWKAIRTRIAADGTLVDVCAGTGKQKNLQAYFDRPAILGPDARGGAMSFMVSTEMAAWFAESKKSE